MNRDKVEFAGRVSSKTHEDNGTDSPKSTKSPSVRKNFPQCKTPQGSPKAKTPKEKKKEYKEAKELEEQKKREEKERKDMEKANAPPLSQEDQEWSDHLDKRLKFLPFQEANFYELVDPNISIDENEEKIQESLQKFSPKVQQRYRAFLKKFTRERLNLSGLELSTVPYVGSIFRQLKVLSLRNNNLTTIPVEICITTANLEELVLSENKLTDIPDIIGGLLYLKKLVVQKNNLNENQLFCHGLQKCTNLEHIDFSHNQIEEIPEWVSYQLPNLNTLLLNNNNLKSLPEKFHKHVGKKNKLSTFNVANNPITTKKFRILHGITG